MPANRRLDLDRARRLLGGTAHLRLATEEEMQEAFPFFDVGALPPVGPMLPLPEVLDVRLLYRDAVLCAGGDHRHGVRLDPRDLVRVAEPRVGDLCEPDDPARRKDFAAPQGLGSWRGKVLDRREPDPRHRLHPHRAPAAERDRGGRGEADPGARARPRPRRSGRAG